jgi:hypothetical protein
VIFSARVTRTIALSFARALERDATASMIGATTTSVMADSMGRRAHASIGTTVPPGFDEIVRERFERSPIRTLGSALRSAIRRSSLGEAQGLL